MRLGHIIFVERLPVEYKSDNFSEISEVHSPRHAPSPSGWMHNETRECNDLQGCR